MQPFDSLAETYDDDFTHTPIGRFLRAQVQARLDRLFRAGEHVLELGCGTGEDALYLAGRGIWVTATDASEGMLNLAREKTRDHPLVRVEKWDIRDAKPVGAQGAAPLQSSSQHFDGVLANFGVINCLDDWRPLAGWLAEILSPGGRVGLGVMSPLCAWEIAWHGIHLDWPTATRRLRNDTIFQPSDGEVIPIHYPTIRHITHDFAPYFRRRYVRGIGLFLPPSDAFGMIEKRPRWLKRLTALEARFGSISALALLADHYWIEFERIET